MECHAENFSQMKCASVCTLRDLLVAAEAVGDHQPVGGGLADGREEFEFADGDGDIVFVALEAEGAGHAAATGSGRLELDADAAQDGFFGGHLHERFVMAVAVKDGLTVYLGRGEMRGVDFEEFAEQESLAG